MNGEKRLWIIEARDGAWGANGICKGELVQCGECKYFIDNTWECVRLSDRFGDEYSDARVYPEYYCADGERRTNEQQT